MGTKTYPCENEFESFLSRHGGSSNAFTDQEATVFAFDVRAKYLKGALNRFARFFTEPLMKADTMGRELEAVDSEFIQAKTNDGPRLEQLLLCCLSRDGHVTTNFSWGNRKSLIGKDESPEAYVYSHLTYVLENVENVENVNKTNTTHNQIQHVTRETSQVPSRALQCQLDETLRAHRW